MKTFKNLFVAFSLLFTSLVWAQVNINTADAETLASLNGIGEAKAAAIVEYRKANGPFKSAEELAEVKGIGDKIVEKIKADVTVK